MPQRSLLVENVCLLGGSTLQKINSTLQLQEIYFVYSSTKTLAITIIVVVLLTTLGAVCNVLRSFSISNLEEM